MPQIEEVREIPLTDLEIGKGQIRMRPGKDLDELVESIRVQGLLEPIVVCPSEKPGKYEILSGQRRFLAHQELQRETILAVILKERVDETTAKAISLTENMVRTDPSRPEIIDAVTDLYKRYGTIKDVAEKTGLPYHRVREYVKYDRLAPELKKLVDEGEIDIKVALRAQDAVEASGSFSVEEAITAAKEMASMSDVQRRRIVKEREENPELPIADVIEAAKSGGKIVQVNVKLGAAVHRSLQSYARYEGTTIDDAASSLIEEALSARGFLEG